MSRTVGQLLDYDGTFLIDEENPENSNITITINASSLDRNHPERNDDLGNTDTGLQDGAGPNLPGLRSKP
ncbi:YceI family protein [Litoreibacter roseus]|uniref:Lipid/polyisoprenoid-binding YceI-like domain-containing protein n=1 Tax=Litoreibacter roseus TaxID=2601869 RepID=A0A6N6JGD5_9RHOB|nr:hypothetical protein KIN_15130 [Litoreibacter roseus]